LPLFNVGETAEVIKAVWRPNIADEVGVRIGRKRQYFADRVLL